MEESLKEVIDSGTDLKTLQSKLSPVSLRVLGQLRAGSKDVPSSDWKMLVHELESIGAISSSEAAIANPESRILPIGYFDENEDFVLYPPSPFTLFFSRDTLSLYTNERGEMTIFSDWPGDPFQYMEEWIKATQGWMNDILKIKKENGDPAYQHKDIIPIENHINSCQKVYDLIKRLSET